MASVSDNAQLCVMFAQSLQFDAEIVNQRYIPEFLGIRVQCNSKVIVQSNSIHVCYISPNILHPTPHGYP